MRQERKKERNKSAIALALCFGVIAIASIFTVKSSIDKLNLQNHDANTIIENETPVTKQVPTVDSRENNKSENQNPKPKSEFEAPLRGNIILVYSSETPVYSKTLDQYMTHYGIDIEAPLDTQVKAALAGTVTKVFTDDKYGNTIELTHENGFKTVYSNLSNASMVETGDVVEKGQVISGVGNTSLFESLDANHLHFELLKDNVHVNPETYIDFK